MSLLSRYLIILSAALFIAVPAGSADLVVGSGWPAMNRALQYGNLWDHFTNRNYGGYNNVLAWPGGLWDTNAQQPVERRTYANYKGFVIGARDVPDPQFPDVIWPYMVGQRDGWNDGEKGQDILGAAPDPLAVNTDTQILFKGRLARRTFRQAYPQVTVDGEVNAWLIHVSEQTGWYATWPQFGADSLDVPYQIDVIDPDLPADLTMDTYTWTRMGVSNSRRVYAFADRRNDDYMFWHWSLINDGLWSRMGVNRVDCCGAVHDTVDAVMMSLMFQWGRGGAGAGRTLSGSEATNDDIWRYYGIDYDGARTEDMRLVYVIDGDQDPAVYDAPHGKQNDIGDPDPVNGHLLSAKTGGWQILHYDTSPSDRRDDPAQPRTMGWQEYGKVIRTGTPSVEVGQGHEAKYNQMLVGYQGPNQYYWGPAMTTEGRGTHPKAASHFASWIKASNDPAASMCWPYVPGPCVVPEVTDIEQQAGFGPDDLAPYETLNGIHVMAVKGLDEPYAAQVGRRWLAGEIDDAEKDNLVHSTIDSLFQTMRQAKAVYESAQFANGVGGLRYASTRAEFEEALRAAVGAGILALSPPAPATFDVLSRPGGVSLAWTLNTTTGSDIAGWRLYRAMGSTKGDSTFALIAELSPGAASWLDEGVVPGFSYYYYLTTFDIDGNESTMHTRTADPAIPEPGPVAAHGRPLRFELGQNAPNPFNPTTSIPFAIPRDGYANLTIYDVSGRVVRTLVDRQVAAGTHAVTWDGTDAIGRNVASGVYLYRLAYAAGELVSNSQTNANEVSVRRMMVVR